MRKRMLQMAAGVLLAAGALALAGGSDNVQRGQASTGLLDWFAGRKLDANLSGFQEVPSVVTRASGDFDLEFNRDGASATYRLQYSNLEGNVLFAHIHIGQRGANGSVSTFLCGGGTKPAPCPAVGGTVNGTIVAADILGPSGQGIDAGEFADFVKAVRAGSAYANVHSSKFPNGEIRGQIGRGLLALD